MARLERAAQAAPLALPVPAVRQAAKPVPSQNNAVLESAVEVLTPDKDQQGGNAQASPAQLDAAFDGRAVPQTRRDDTVVDDYFGTKIKDPYRWLEDDNSDETKAWVEAQNEYTSSFLAGIPEREEIARRLKGLMNYERCSTPWKEGKYWIYYRNTGLQDQEVLMKSRRLYGEPEVLLDPSTLSKDGTAALDGISFSKDGKYMAYAVAKAGSDWMTWHVRDVETGKDLPDTIEWTKFTGASWSKDNLGFYYTRFPKPADGNAFTAANTHARVYYHRLGTRQGEDALVYERPDKPEWSFGAGQTEDGRYLLLYQHEGTEPKNRIWIKDLEKPGSDFKPLFDGFDSVYSVVDNEGSKFFVQTRKDAPRGRLIMVDADKPGPENWKDVLPESRTGEVLEGVERVGKRFVAVWSKDAHEVMRVYGPRGGLRYEVKLPGIGSVSGFSAPSAKETRRGFFTFASFNHPRTTFRLDLDTGKTRAYRRPKIAVDPSRFEVEQVFYASKDGTRVPMFIVHKKGLKYDGQNPTYLYGYGGFNISMTPYFSAANVAWLEKGGVYAVANIRGGGEYGQAWHDAGRLDKKQNVFDDFIAAAEYLIARGITSPSRLAVGGGSNGGLLVGAVMTQRPDLFGAAVPEVGVLDMLRFHLFTIGRGWRSDYGSSETQEGFDTLIKYSPLHNVRPGTRYPAALVMTGDHDDRVVPAHSHKFTAALQAAQAGDAPILTRVERDAGHGAGTPLSKVIQEIADKWAFLLRALGVSRVREAAGTAASALTP